MLKIFASFICIMVISVSSAFAYSPQDNAIQQTVYEFTGAYLGETYDELNQQYKLKENDIGSIVIPLEIVEINGVIVRQDATAFFTNNQLYSIIIGFDDKDIEKTKKIQAYFVNRLGQPSVITKPTEDMQKVHITVESYSWINQTYSISVNQGYISFSEINLSEEAGKQGIINYIEYCQGYINYSKGNSSTPNMYYVGERGKKFFEAEMKKLVEYYKELFRKNTELANYVKTYFADKPEYVEALKLFFD